MAEKEKKPNSLGKDLLYTFIPGLENPKESAMSVIRKVVAPAAQRICMDAIKIIFKNEDLDKPSNGRRSEAIPAEATKYIDRSVPSEHIYRLREYDNVIFGSEEKAQAVLARLSEICAIEDKVSVKQFYSLAGLKSEFTCQYYGWYRLSDEIVTIERVAGGYRINFPKVQSLETAI